VANNSRSAIDAALFAQLVGASWGSPPVSWQTSSQHFVSWENFSEQNQPALFLRRILEEAQQTKAYGLTKYMLRYEVWIYVRTQSNDTSTNPYDYLNPLIDAVDAAVAAHPVIGRNNLGGLVDNCYISGQIMIADGTDNGQAVIRIPISAVTGI
jgi:hypothetical protein